VYNAKEHKNHSGNRFTPSERASFDPLSDLGRFDSRIAGLPRSQAACFGILL